MPVSCCRLLPLLIGLAGPLAAPVHATPFPADSATLHPPLHGTLHGFRALAVPTVLIAYGAAAVGHHRPLGLFSSTEAQEVIQQPRYQRLRCQADDYIQFSPVAAVLALDAFGVPAAHSPAGQTIRLAASMGLMAGVVTGLKYTIREERPDRSARNSFPSGHTATAFAAAEFLHQEFRKQPVLVAGGYAVATAVGVLRMVNNKHWLSDVCVGAGLGMLSTKMAYCTLNYVRWTPRRAAHPGNSLARTLVLPGYVPGSGATLVVTVRL